jgi:hypothetical protein
MGVIGEFHTPRDSTTLMTEQKTEHVTRRQPALFHGRACECWKADDVAGSMDVRNLSLKVFIHFQPATRANRHSRRFKVELITVRLSAYGIDKRITFRASDEYREAPNLQRRRVALMPPAIFASARV